MLRDICTIFQDAKVGRAGSQKQGLKVVPLGQILMNANSWKVLCDNQNSTLPFIWAATKASQQAHY